MDPDTPPELPSVDGLRAQTAQLRAIAQLGRLALGDVDIDTVMGEAVSLVRTTLTAEYCKILELRPDGDELLLRWEAGWRAGAVGETTVPARPRTRSQAAYTLGTATPVVVENFDDESRFDGPELLASHGVKSGISVLIGSVDSPWGVLGVHSTAVRRFSDHDIDFIQSVGNVLACFLDQRSYATEIESQRRELASIEQINHLISSINTALISVTSVTELEATVCDRLVSDGRYAAAVIAHLSPRRQEITIRAAAGIDDEYRAAVGAITPAEMERSFGTHVRQTREPQVVNEVEGSERVPTALQAWARERELHSVLAVPIAYRSISYGLLLIWSASPEAFSHRERRLVTELANTTGYAINAINNQQLLFADQVVELTFEKRGSEAPTAFDLVLESCAISFDGVIQHADNTVFCYITLVEGSAERLVEAAETEPHIDSARILSSTRGESILEFVFSERSVFATLITLGGQIQRAVNENGQSRIGAIFQPDVDVPWVVETVQKYHPEWKLFGKEHRDKTAYPAPSAVRTTALDELTDRQRAVLQTAFHAGYFEWPRHSTAEEVAASLRISPPTFHKHIRTSQQKLFASMFAAEPHSKR